MMRKARTHLFQNACTLTLSLAIATLLVACGGGDKPTPSATTLLRLNEQDVSAENYRAFLRATRSTDTASFRASCGQIKDLSPDAIVSMIDGMGGSRMKPVPGSTPKPGQKENRDDAVKAAAVFKEECSRT